MKKSELKKLIKNILKEQVSPRRTDHHKSSELRRIANQINNASSDDEVLDILIRNYISLGMSNDEIKNHLRKLGLIKNSQGCAANSVSEQTLIPNKGPGRDMGEERFFLVWIGLCVITVGLLNHFEVGYWDPGENDCVVNPAWC